MRSWLFSLILIATVGIGGVGTWYWTYLGGAAPGQGEVIVTIPRGLGVRGIGALLEEKGLLANDIRFLVMVQLAGFKGKLQAGEYSIPLGLTPPEVIRLLAKGSTRRHHVTIPEGLTVDQIAALFARDGWGRRDRFLALARDGSFIRGLGIEANHLEGYLFPETYTFLRHETDESVILRRMVEQFLLVWNRIQPAEQHGLSRHQVLTLASIVEKETAAPGERPLIARVFLNRLTIGMRLQSDPTVIYDIAGHNGNITRADLNRPTSHNTYIIPGLPPGPICNPGQAALEAVLHPEPSSALYFVSKNDGTHVFSTNLTDHNRAVRTYQQGP